MKERFNILNGTCQITFVCVLAVAFKKLTLENLSTSPALAHLIFFMFEKLLLVFMLLTLK